MRLGFPPPNLSVAANNGGGDHPSSNLAWTHCSVEAMRIITRTSSCKEAVFSTRLQLHLI